MLETLLEKMQNVFDRFRQWKCKHLQEFSEYVTLSFHIEQYLANHSNRVHTNNLKNFLTNDMGFDAETVYHTLYRMKGLERGHSDKKVLNEDQEGYLSLVTLRPRFTLLRDSVLESWKFVTVPIGLLTILFTFFIPDLAWARFFLAVLFICILIWIVDDFFVRRIRWT